MLTTQSETDLPDAAPWLLEDPKPGDIVQFTRSFGDAIPACARGFVVGYDDTTAGHESSCRMVMDEKGAVRLVHGVYFRIVK
jgi:hypothetical protein